MDYITFVAHDETMTEDREPGMEVCLTALGTIFQQIDNVPRRKRDRRFNNAQKKQQIV